MVLKGGTALLLAYGLPRFSVDLDFDGRRPGIDLTRAIRAGAAAASLGVEALTTKKNTDTTLRHMLHYSQQAGTALKIEVSYRQGQQIDENDVVQIDDVRTYRIDTLAGLKIDALVNRVKARDVFDTGFLLHRYPDHISDHDLLRIDQLIDIIGLDGLEATMLDDDIISHFDLTHIAIGLVDNTLRLRRERGL